jgi:C-terminal processing protease CtpA/Prc
MRISHMICSLAVLGGSLTNGPRDLEPAQMRQDLDVLKRSLEEAHGGLHRFSSKAEVDQAFRTAFLRLDRPMSTRAFIAVVSEALTVVRDGHMRLEYDATTNQSLATARLLPLRVASEGGRIVITSNDAVDNEAIAPGMELLSVNGRATADIVKLILPKLPGDGFIETGRTWRLARNFARDYWLFVDQGSTFAVTARAADGSTVTTTLGGATNEERSRAVNAVNSVMAANLAKLDGPDETVSLRFPEGHDIGVLRIRHFDGETFTSSVATAFTRLRDVRARALILDVRGNVGGVDEYGALLVSQLVATPFRYFERIKVTTIHPSFATWKAATFEDLRNGTRPARDGGFLVEPRLHSGVAEQTPAPNPFLGRLFVLIDGGTFSTAADVCAQIRSRTKATFIGEETGGGFEGNTSGLNALIVLPHSGLKLKIHMYGYWNAVAGGQRGRGTLPDIAAVRTVRDVLAGTDPPLDLAIELANDVAGQGGSRPLAVAIGVSF